jgi:WD40 repeat protein
MKKLCVLMLLLCLVPDLFCQEVAVFPQLGHSDAVSGAVFGPDGKYIVSSAKSGTIVLWETANGRELRRFPVPGKQVVSLAHHPQKGQIVSGSWKGEISVWDAGTGTLINDVKIAELSVNSVAYSPDGTKLAAASFDGTVTVLAAESLETQITLRGHNGEVTSLGWSQNGRRVLSASGDGTVKLWDIASGTAVKTIAVPGGPVYTACFSSDEKTILSGSFDGVLRIWNTDTGALITVLRGHSGAIHRAVFSPDGTKIASGSHDKTVRIWDAISGKGQKTLSGHKMPVAALAFDSSGKRILSASHDYTAKIWDTESGTLIKSLEGQVFGITAVVISPDGTRAASGSGRESINPMGIVQEWDIETGRLLWNFTGHTKTIEALAYSPDGTKLASASLDKTIRVWDTRTGEQLAVLEGHRDGVTSVAFSPDGNHLVSASYDTTVRIWDIRNNSSQVLTGHRAAVLADVRYSPDGRYIASLDRNAVLKIWDVESRTEKHSFEQTPGASFTFNRDGTKIFFGDFYGYIYVMELESGTKESPEPVHREAINAISLSLDEKYLLTGSGDPTSSNGDRSLKLHDAETGETLLTRDFSGGVYAADWSRDGKRIIAGTGDGDLYLLDPQLKILARFIGFNDGEWICVNPDGYYSASPVGDKYLNVRINNDVYGIDQFRTLLYRPEFVEASLSGAASAKSLSVQDLAAYLPPTVEILSPEYGAEINGDVVQVRIRITNNTQPVTSLRVVVNAALAVKKDGEELLESGLRGAVSPSGQWEETFTLTLKPGWNPIEVIADTGYAVESGSIGIDCLRADSPEQVPNLWIFAAGVNSYDEGSLSPLKYAGDDAREIVNAFKAQEGKRYGKVHSMLLEGTAAWGQIQNGFRFLEQAGPQDLVILFLAGHGVSDRDGNFLFLPKDARRRGNDWEQAISRREIDAIRNILGQKLVFIDACHSAANSRTIDNTRLFRAFDNSTVVFTSSKGNESSLELDNKKHGIFTYTILEGLKGGADLDVGFGKDGFVTMDELNTYVKGNVSRLAREYLHTQTPAISLPSEFAELNLAEIR